VSSVQVKQGEIGKTLEHVKEQTTRTNGRVSVLEVEVDKLNIKEATREGYRNANDKTERRFGQFVFTPTTTLFIAILSGIAVNVLTTGGK
jgi:hypothetical protein